MLHMFQYRLRTTKDPTHKRESATRRAIKNIFLQKLIFQKKSGTKYSAAALCANLITKVQFKPSNLHLEAATMFWNL